MHSHVSAVSMTKYFCSLGSSILFSYCVPPFRELRMVFVAEQCVIFRGCRPIRVDKWRQNVSLCWSYRGQWRMKCSGILFFCLHNRNDSALECNTCSARGGEMVALPYLQVKTIYIWCWRLGCGAEESRWATTGQGLEGFQWSCISHCSWESVLFLDGVWVEGPLVHLTCIIIIIIIIRHISREWHI